MLIPFRIRSVDPPSNVPVKKKKKPHTTKQPKTYATEATTDITPLDGCPEDKTEHQEKLQQQQRENVSMQLYIHVTCSQLEYCMEFWCL